MKMELKSWKAAQAEIATIVERVNADPALALAATTNPLHAIEEVGYAIEPAMREEFEDRIRFGEHGASRLRELRHRIRHVAGESFDPRSPDDIHSFVAKHVLNTHESCPDACHLSYGDPPPPDPLEALRGKHMVIEDLLEFRKLDATHPRFADRSVYDQVRRGALQLPISRVVFHLKAHEGS